MYDNLIPDLFGVPANFGGPTILETAFEWIIFEPEGTVERFSDETGVPVEMVEKYWKRLQLLAVLDEEHRTIGNVAKEWLNRHPDGNMTPFCSALGFSELDIIKLKSSPDNPFPLRKDNVNPAIIKWFEEHPDGTPTDCANETGISRRYIYWNYESLGIRKRSERIAERDARIIEWIENHPDQTRKEIASHFNVSPSTISLIKRKMKQCADPCTPIKEPHNLQKASSKEAEHIERMSAWIKTHKPYGTRTACANDLGLNIATVCKLWKKAGGEARPAKDLKSEAMLLAIVTWMAEHPGAKDIDCALALKDMGVHAKSLPVYKSQISRIAKWRTAHSEVSQEACAQDLNFSLRRVINMWPSATIWMEHIM